ncbi:MAG: hypothetical protein M3P30_08020 [Chloroflexota bacterium]|nr:hypothetical protein [Chloroflexota bacterium]
MSTYRALLWTAAAFAVSLAALGAAAGTAWARCGRGTQCSSELALGIVAVAPAALLLAVMVLLIRMRTGSPTLARLLLVVALAVAVAPLAAFIFRDVHTLLIVAGLFAALSYLAVTGEDVWTDAPAASEAQPAPEPERLRPPSGSVELLIGQMQAAEAAMARVTGDLVKLLRDAAVPAPPVPRSNGAHPTASAHREAAAPATISLVLPGLRDFDELAAIYGALEDLPAVTHVSVQRFEGSFAWLELTLRPSLTAEALIPALSARAHVPIGAQPVQHEPAARP